MALLFSAMATADESATPLLNMKSNRSLAEIRQDMPKIAKKHGYGVVAVHDMKAILAKKGHPIDRGVLIFEICNPAKAKQVVEKKVEMATLLPCRIAVWQEGKQTVLAMVRPAALLGLLGKEPGLDDVAREVGRDLTTIMNEVAR
ncbi:MAG: DUF302 domain-containing protein [Deltaproteobacteria bacterium]|nr:DUF302 domain-containing protein [Deltaproteobacteria bacterium]